MAKNKNYTGKDIVTLTDREHVRQRTQIYLGNMHKVGYTIPLFLKDTFTVKEIKFIPAVFKAVGEIIDNSIDEFAHITQKNKTLKIIADTRYARYEISDNGRGIPIDKHESGKYTPEVALGSLRAGRNFSDDKEAGVIGQNGVGSACTNYCSSQFDVTIHRDGKRYGQKFSEGAETVSRPSIRTATGKKSGTKVDFQLDKSVFKDVRLPSELMESRAVELAFTNPGITVDYNNTKHKFKKGLEDVVKNIVKNTQFDDGTYFKFEHKKDNIDLEFYVIFGVNQEVDEQMFTWVNSSLLFDGGLCNTQFLNAFVDKTINHLSSAAKKQKSALTKHDVREGLLILGNLKITNPEYDAQAKTRLTGPNMRKEMADIVGEMWSMFTRKNKVWLDVVLERAVLRHHVNANKKAIKDHKKNLKRKVEGLDDANSPSRFNCQILITEGDSAASMITDARDPDTTASMPLSGKINNVYGTTPAQLLNMQKLTNLLAAIGLVPGMKAARMDLRYGKILIATDADYDGNDIFTLLVNLFYQHWPELFDPEYEPIIYRLIAPNVCLTKGTQRIHFTTRDEYEEKKNKYKGFTVDYYKGLGSMVKEDWEMILRGDTDTLVPIVDDGDIKDTLKLLFGPSSDDRKTWLQGEEE